MKSLLHRALQRLRAAAINWSCALMSWACHELGECFDREDCIRAHIARLVDSFAKTLFNLAYPGSDEEINQAIEACIPAQYLSERQRAAAMAEFANPCFECLDCQWVGFLHQARESCCASCGSDSIYLRDRAQVWVPYRDYRALAIVPSCAIVKGGCS